MPGIDPSVNLVIEKLQNSVATPLSGGRPKVFATPADLWTAACTYFEYCVTNPIPYEVYRYRKKVSSYRMRAMSLKGLCQHLGINDFRYYKKRVGFDDVTTQIMQVIYIHNFTGAACGLLKGKVVGWTLRYDFIKQL